MVDIESFVYFVIGIDPGFTRTGISLIGVTQENKIVLIDFYQFAEPSRNKKHQIGDRALLMAGLIQEKIDRLLETYVLPTDAQAAISIEGCYPGKDKRGALTLARLIQCVYTMYHMLNQSEIGMFEYPPGELKRCIGNGKTITKIKAIEAIQKILTISPADKKRLEKIDKTKVKKGKIMTDGKEAILDSVVTGYGHLVMISKGE